MPPKTDGDGIEEGEKMSPREEEGRERNSPGERGGYIKKNDQTKNRVLITQWSK